jgi:hypothetical protein
VSRAAQDAVREQLTAAAAREPVRRRPRAPRRWRTAVLIVAAGLGAAVAEVTGLL